MRTLLLSLVLLPLTAAAADFTVEALLERLVARQELQADYRGTRHLTMLTHELHSRGTLTGDASLLRRHYRLALSGTRNDWELRLTPLSQALASQAPEIRLRGAGNRLQAVHIRAASGEESSLRLLDDAED